MAALSSGCSIALTRRTTTWRIANVAVSSLPSSSKVAPVPQPFMYAKIRLARLTLASGSGAGSTGGGGGFDAQALSTKNQSAPDSRMLRFRPRLRPVLGPRRTWLPPPEHESRRDEHPQPHDKPAKKDARGAGCLQRGLRGDAMHARGDASLELAEFDRSSRRRRRSIGVAAHRGSLARDPEAVPMASAGC